MLCSPCRKVSNKFVGALAPIHTKNTNLHKLIKLMKKIHKNLWTMKIIGTKVCELWSALNCKGLRTIQQNRKKWRDIQPKQSAWTKNRLGLIFFLDLLNHQWRIVYKFSNVSFSSIYVCIVLESTASYLMTLWNQ